MSKKALSIILSVVIAAGMLTLFCSCGKDDSDKVKEGSGGVSITVEQANSDNEASDASESTDVRQEASEEKEHTEETAESETTEEENTEEETTEEAAVEKEEDAVDGMRPEFKEAMDSYESFMNEYVSFMKKYKANPGDLSLLMDYADYINDYSEFVEDFEKWDDGEMNAVETAYYIDVQMRVSKKLLEVAE